MKTLQPLLIVGQPLGQELEGHRLAQLQIVGPVDLAHATAAEAAHDAVPPGQRRAGREAGVVDPAGMRGVAHRRLHRRDLVLSARSRARRVIVWKIRGHPA